MMETLLDRENLIFDPPGSGCVLSLTGLPGGDGKIYDRSPYGNHGTITGATWKRLPSGLWCLSFDGLDDEVTHPTFLDVMPSALTIMAWIYIVGGTGESNFIFGKSNVVGQDRIYFDKFTDEKLRLFVEGADDGGKAAYSGSTISQDAWHHVVGIYEASQTLKVYLDLVESTGETAGTMGDGTASDFCIGCHIPGSDAQYHWEGYIALLRIYNRALSALEIQNLFNQEQRLFGVW